MTIKRARQHSRVRSLRLAFTCALLLALARTANLAKKSVAVSPSELIATVSGTSPRRSKLRVAAYSRIWPTHRVGGMQAHAESLYRGLAHRGHEIHVITTRHPRLPPVTSEVYGHLFVHYCQEGEPEVYSSEFFQCTSRLFDELAPFDIIHSESNAAREFLGNSSLPTVVTWHGFGYEAWRSKINSFYLLGDMDSMATVPMDFGAEFEMMTGYQHHIAISHQAARDLVGVMHLPDYRVHTILNGIDISLFKPNSRVKANFYRKHSIPTDALVLGIGGKLTTMKGSQQLLSILKDLLL